MRVLRKLAIVAFSFSAAVFAANYLLPLSALLWLALALALAALLLFLGAQRWQLGFLLTAAGLALGFLCFYVHTQFTLVPAWRLAGQSVQIRGEVCSDPQVFPGYSRVEIRLEGEDLPRGKLLLYADGALLDSFQPGDALLCTARLKRADERYGERYDSYLSRGVYLTGSVESDLRRVQGRGGLRTLPLRFNRALSERVSGIFPDDVSAFMKSLMLGDKSELYRDRSLYLALSRAGFLHVAAVSGMHIAFLVGLIQLLLGKSRASSVLCLALLWFFVLVTGSTPSAVRAGVMQSFLMIAPLVRRENDPATSLSAALAIILLSNPFAAGSVSLHLSFSAMAGILWLSEPLRDAISDLFPERAARLLRAPISAVAGSLAVLALSVPLMAWHFRSVSLLSPITTALGLWAVSLCFCGGYLSCLLSFVLPALGSAAAWLVSWLARYLIWLSGLVSGVSFSVLYLRSVFPFLWIALVYVLAILSRFSRLRKGLKFLLPLSLSILSLALLLWSTRQYYRSGEGVVSVLDVGQGQSIVLMAGDRTVMVDCGSIYTLENAGEEAGAYLRSRGRDHVDALVLTHLHSDHCNGAAMLMEMIPVKTLLLPADVEDEDEMLPEILDAAERHGTQLQILRRDSRLTAGLIHADLFVPAADGPVNERCLTGVFSIGDYDVLITGDSSQATERALLKRHPLRDLELLIVGHHGSRYASSPELLTAIGADTAVISVGYNPYGHPTEETLDRLREAGYRVLRTDTDGTLEFYLGKEHG